MNVAMRSALNFELPDETNVHVLIEDQSRCADLLKSDMDNQCLRRVYCRTNLTLVEGVVSYFKSSTYQFNQFVMLPFRNLLDHYEIDVDVPVFMDVVPLTEAGLLLDHRPTVASNGEIRKASTFLDFKTNFKFTFQMVDRVFKASCAPNYGDIRQEWDMLQQTVKIRNRITHPKVGVSLDITDDELKTLGLSSQWFLDFTGDVFTKIGESMDESMMKLNASTEPLVDKALADMAKLIAAHEVQGAGWRVVTREF
jgi:hypothetical protein